MLRISSILSVVVVPALVGSALADSPFNVDCFYGWGDCYRPMEWTPVEVGISSKLTEPFGGSVTISARQDGLNTMNVTHEFVLTPDIPLHLPLVTKLAFGADKCSVRLADERGRTRWHYDFDLWNFSSANRRLTAVGENDLFIGLVGRQRFGLVRLSKQSVCRSRRGRGRVYLKAKLPRMAPWDWTGFVSLDLLILYDPDWSLFNRHQLSAIAQWVSNGGKLFVVLGSHPLPAENPIAHLLPFQVQQAKQITVGPESLETWQLNYTEPEPVTCWPLVPKAKNNLCQAETVSTGECLFATGYVGFGRVAVLAFDPSTLSDTQRAQSTRFWVARFRAILEDTQPPTVRTTERIVGNQQRKSISATRCPLTGDMTHPDKYAGGIELTLGGLEPGRYRMISWHNNPRTQHSNFDVLVDGVLHSRENPQSEAADDENAARAVTEFTVSPGNDVVIEFRPVSSGFNERVMLCGFELVKLHTVQNGTSLSHIQTRVFGVDFGATGQIVTKRFIGLGFRTNDRRNFAQFNDTDGLPAGVTVTLKPTNAEDKLQFNPSYRVATNPRVRDRVVADGSPSDRSIEFAEDAEGISDDNERRYEIGRAQVGINTITNYLYAISEMRPLSIWWVIFLLTLLAFLLGPVDYKLLKRLDRLPLTWLTCAVWIVIFTVGAYYGVRALRGGKMQFRTVSVLDGIEESACAWSTAYSGLFAPHSDDYQLKGLSNNQWWSAIASTGREHIYAQRWQTGGRSTNIYCYQHDGGNLPYSLPINIWTMQCLLSESPLQQLPFSAQVKCQDDELTLSIANQSDSRILSGYVLFGKDRAFDFGPVPAHTNKQFRGQLRHRRHWTSYDDIEHYPAKFKCEKAFFARGCLQRTRAISAYLACGAAVVCAEYDNAPLPFAVKDHSCDYNHIQMARLVVFPTDLAKPDLPGTERTVEK